MTEKIKIVGSWKLDKVGWKKIGKSFLLTLAAVGIEFVANITGLVDFGSLTPYVTTFIPFAVNFFKKLILPYQTSN